MLSNLSNSVAMQVQSVATEMTGQRSVGLTTFTTPALALEGKWNLRIVDQYAAADFATLASSCSCG